MGTAPGPIGSDIEVVGAVIMRGNSVLVAQRGPDKTLAGLWEFPGGKVESGESPAEALAREIDEELGCQIEVGDHVTTTSHRYEFGTINLSTYHARIMRGAPQASEHAQVQWVQVPRLQELDWAPADIPAVEILVRASED